MVETINKARYRWYEFVLDHAKPCRACMTAGISGCREHNVLTIDEMKWSGDGRLVVR